MLAIAINLDPNILQLGPLTLSWHGVFAGIGIVAGVTFGVRTAVMGGAREQGAYNLALWSTGGGIIGARLFHVLDNWDFYAANPASILLINNGGIAIYGAIVGGILTGVVYARLTGLKLAAIADGGGLGLILGQAIGRIGDVINGEHRGLPLDAPWAVVYTNPNTLGDPSVPSHLAVGYELVWDLLVFALLVALRKRNVGTGLLFWMYLLLYSLGRFWISFYRYDAIILLGLRQAQLVAVGGVAIGLFGLAWWAILRFRRPMVTAGPR